MDTETEWAALLGSLDRPVGGRLDGAAGGRLGRLRRALQLACTVGPNSVGCSVTEAADTGFRTPVSTNQLALELDLAQYAAANGPCVAACRDRRPHSIPSMADDREFPEFAAAAVRHGVRSSLSLPLPLPGPRRPSALNLYARNPQAFDSARSRAVAELLARCVARLLPVADMRSVVPGPAFDEALARRSRSMRAVAVLARTAGLDRSAAFTVLTQRSRSEHRSIFCVVDDVIAEADR